ncbi:hypothetical protein B566_EDAN000220 [Ephemera danica]|nr:hypothetical protein B566_EDAN000220 [Ephemera danica]
MTRRSFRQAALAGVVLVIGLGFSLIQPERSAAIDPAKAYFAGGCFWCMEEVFEKVEGVMMAVSGYMDGTVVNPTYEQVSAGGTGHAESVEVTYDPAKVSYEKLVEVFWRNVDPLTPNAQFCDRGNQYRSAIFPSTPEEQKLAEASRMRLEESKRFHGPIVTQIVSAPAFYPAEAYHQDFYQKNPVRYKLYKFNCGRTQRLEEVWGKP